MLQQIHRVRVMSTLQTRKRKLNFLEIEWFADYVNTGPGIQTHKLLTPKLSARPPTPYSLTETKEEKGVNLPSYIVEKQEQRGTPLIFTIAPVFF